MATREELKELSQLRLREAEALFAAGLYDGCVYLCGYVVELALKAVICSTLAISEYPNEQMFKTHVFKRLMLLAGLQEQITAANPMLLKNWSAATEWESEWRYEPVGTYDRRRAQEVLEAIKADPDGVLPYLSQRW
jgi:HEPN domain-containing protein